MKIINNTYTSFFMYFLRKYVSINPEWPHRRFVGMAFRRSHVRGSLSAASLVICRPHCTVQSSGGTALCRVGGATSQLDLPSLTPLSVAGCGRLQLGTLHWATSVNYCKQLITEPTFCGSKFSTGRLLAIEDFTFLPFCFGILTTLKIQLLY